MRAEDTTIIATAVVGLTQMAKWGGVHDKKGPLVVLLLAAIGVVIWAFSQQATPQHTDLFSYFVGWIAIASQAAGVFGFTRAASSAVTSTKAPPGGAGQSPTDKPGMTG